MVCVIYTHVKLSEEFKQGIARPIFSLQPSLFSSINKGSLFLNSVHFLGTI